MDVAQLPAHQNAQKQHNRKRNPKAQGARHIAVPGIAFFCRATPSEQVEISDTKASQNDGKNNRYSIIHGFDYPVISSSNTSPRVGFPVRARFRFWLITVAALVSALLTLSLGRWQLARAAQKEALQQRITQQSQLPALTASAVWAGGGATKSSSTPPAAATAVVEDLLLDRQFTLSGRWLPEHTLYLDNRPLNGKQGFYVLTPLQEVSSGQVVLVQRGWVQRDFTDRERVPALVTPLGIVQVTGRIAGAPSHTLELFGASAGDAGARPTVVDRRIRQNLGLNAYRAETKLPLWDHLLLQTDVLSGGLRRDWPAPSVGVEKHYGYAFQWFGLSALIAVLYVWFQVVAPLRRSHRPPKPE